MTSVAVYKHIQFAKLEIYASLMERTEILLKMMILSICNIFMKICSRATLPRLPAVNHRYMCV